jgi:hypothetical protein
MIVRDRLFGFNTMFMRLCEIRNTSFPKRISRRHAPRGNPAVGRDGQDARATRRDGRHPKYENHGRIAGR